jgi:REP element-mobilizing transposase RayT
VNPNEIDELEIATPASFRPFDLRGEVTVYQRNLPHWRQAGASYFVTFRTEDSIPAEIGNQLRAESEEWSDMITNALARNKGVLPEELKREDDEFRRRTFARLESLLDGGAGACLLARLENRSLLADAMRHFDGERYDLYAAVIMPNHCHVLIRPYSGHELSELVGAWKSYTSRRIGGRRGPSGAFWQSESFDRIIRDEDHFRKAVRYILKNPAKARIASGVSWLWSCNVKHASIDSPESP